MNDLAGHGVGDQRVPVSGAQPGEDVVQLSDAGLVECIARGSHDALAEAYSRHGSNMHKQARRLRGGGDGDDVVKDVFLRLWDQPERFDPTRGSLRSFLTMQTRGRAIDALRSDNARRARETTTLSAPRPAAAATDDRALARLAGDRAWGHLARLNDGERQAIALAYFGGHTYREVAILLEQPEGTVKARIRAGLRRLRNELDGKPDDPRG
ncbi:MAG: sigma-70 family RNA polymerase sigma factor [Acidimicrobiales bacterium]